MIYRLRHIVYFILAVFCFQARLDAQLTTVLQGKHAGEVNHASYSPDGKYLYTVGEEGNIFCWDLHSSRHFQQLKGIQTAEKAADLCFIDEQSFLVFTQTGDVHLGKVDLDTTSVLEHFNFIMRNWAMCSNNNDPFLAFTKYTDNTYKILFYYPKRDKGSRFFFSESAQSQIKGEVKFLHYEPQNNVLFIGDELGYLYVLNCQNRKLYPLGRISKGKIKNIAASENQIMAVAETSEKNSDKKLIWMDFDWGLRKVKNTKVLKEKCRVVFMKYIETKMVFALGETAPGAYYTQVKYIGSSKEYKRAQSVWNGIHNQPVNVAAVRPKSNHLAMFPYGGEYLIFHTGINQVIQRLHTPAAEVSDFGWVKNQNKVLLFNSSLHSVMVADLQTADYFSYSLPFKRESSHTFLPDGTFIIEDNHANKLYKYDTKGHCDSIDDPFTVLWEINVNKRLGHLMSYTKDDDIAVLDIKNLNVLYRIPFKLGILNGSMSYSVDRHCFWLYNMRFNNNDTVQLFHAQNGTMTKQFVRQSILPDSLGQIQLFDVIDSGKYLIVYSRKPDENYFNYYHYLHILDIHNDFKVLRTIPLSGAIKSFLSGRTDREIMLNQEIAHGVYQLAFFNLDRFAIEPTQILSDAEMEAPIWIDDDRCWIMTGKSTYVYRGQGGELKLVNAKTGQIEYALVSNSKGFAVVGKNGDLLCTKGSSDMLALQAKMDNSPCLVPGNVFEAQYNKPHVVLKDLGVNNQRIIQAYESAYDKRMSRLGEQAKLEDHNRPEVSLNLIPGTLVTSQRDQELEITYSSKFPVNAVHIEQNGCPIYGPRGYKVDSPSTRGSKAVTVTLMNGLNKFSFTASDSTGLVSLPRYTEILLVEEEPIPLLYYIGIGVSHYQDSTHNLQYAAKDIRDMSAWVAGQYASQIDTFIDENALWENIVTVKEKIAQLQPWDKVVVSFSGHGLLSDNLDLYLGLNGMDFKNPKNGGLKLEDLVALLDSTQSLHKLILIDACHSGEIDRDGWVQVSQKDTVQGETRGTNITIRRKPEQINAYDFMKAHFEDIATGNGSVIISAAGGEEYALEMPDLQNGVFTYALLSFLNSEAHENSENASISALKAYLLKTVPELTQGRQKPTMRRENALNDWKL